MSEPQSQLVTALQTLHAELQGSLVNLPGLIGSPVPDSHKKVILSILNNLDSFTQDVINASYSSYKVVSNGGCEVHVSATKSKPEIHIYKYVNIDGSSNYTVISRVDDLTKEYTDETIIQWTQDPGEQAGANFKISLRFISKIARGGKATTVKYGVSQHGCAVLDT